MDTASLNLLDKLISHFRLWKVNTWVQSKSVILDIGCGQQAYFLRGVKHKILQGVGIDYDLKSNTQDGNLTFIKATAGNPLPFTDNHFDQIFMLAVLEHLPLDSLQAVFSEMIRILKPQGKIILTVPTPRAKPLLEFMAFRLHIINALEIKDHRKYYDHIDMKQLADRFLLTMVHYSKFQLGCNSLTVLQKD